MSNITNNTTSLQEILDAVNALPDAGGSGPLQEKSVSPTHSEQEVLPDEGYGGLSKVTVGAVPRLPAAVASVESQEANVVGPVVNLGVEVDVLVGEPETVREFSADEILVGQLNGAVGGGSTDTDGILYFNGSSTSRLSYPYFDIPAEAGYTYIFEFEATSPDIIITVEFYPQESMDLVASEESFSSLKSMGWAATNTSGVMWAAPDGYNAALRFTFKYYANAVPFVGGEVTKVVIKRLAI